MAKARMSSFAREARLPGQGGSGGVPGFLLRFNSRGRKAVRLRHEQGQSAAKAYLDAAFKQDLAHSHAATVTNAQNAIDSFDSYCGLDLQDGRPFREANKETTLAFGGDYMTIKLDVIIEDGQLVVPRFVLWDVARCTADRAKVIAYPCFEASEQLYGPGGTKEVQVWHLRQAVGYTVTPTQAMARGRGCGDSDRGR